MSDDKFNKTLLQQILAGIAILIVIIAFYSWFFSFTGIHPLFDSHSSGPAIAQKVS